MSEINEIKADYSAYSIQELEALRIDLMNHRNEINAKMREVTTAYDLKVKAEEIKAKISSLGEEDLKMIASLLNKPSGQSMAAPGIESKEKLGIPGQG